MSVLFSVRQLGKRRRAYIFADTQKSYGAYGQKRTNSTKIFETDNGIGGITGDEEALEDIKRLLNQFSNPFLIVSWPKKFDYSVLFIDRFGVLYEIDSPGVVSRPDDKIYASGSGETWAIGAAYGWRIAKKLDIETASHKAIVNLGNCAVSSAIHHDLHCGGMIEAVSLKIEQQESL